MTTQAPAASPAVSSAPAATPQARAGSFWLAAGTLWRREMVRFFRQPNRVVSAALTPLIFWLFMGSGLSSFSLPVANHGGAAPTVMPATNTGGAALNSLVTEPSAVSAAGGAAGSAASTVGYLEYFFPGTVVLVLMFTAIFSTISVIEDRREGFLQGVLVAPVSRLSIALGKILGGASIAMVQGILFLALWPLLGHWPGMMWMLLSLGLMFALAVGLTGLGLCIAWPMDSTAGFHAVMMLFLMPMWFLSGAVFPATESTPGWMKALMWINPLTYGQSAFTEAMTAGRATAGAPVGLVPAAAITVAFAAATVLLAAHLVNRPRRDGTL
ncbi:MAG: ABC transporter permease [Planctomycetota bacterium]|nr:ABC transporter permease [Planctomycetota bacterium]